MFKKLLFSVFVVSMSCNVFAWNIKFVNNSDGQVQVKFNYAGRGVCAPNAGIVEKGGETNFNAGGCCGEGYWIQKESGLKVGSQFSGGVGGNTCVNHRITIINGADGTLSAIHETYY